MQGYVALVHTSRLLMHRYCTFKNSIQALHSLKRSDINAFGQWQIVEKYKKSNHYLKVVKSVILCELTALYKI